MHILTEFKSIYLEKGELIMTQYIVIGVIAVFVLFIIVYIKMTIDEKKGANSQEKQKIQEIVNKVVPGGATYKE